MIAEKQKENNGYYKTWFHSFFRAAEDIHLSEMIKSIREQITIPLIVGGGIKTPEKAISNCRAGADLIVVGNSIENDTMLISRMAEAIHSA